MPKQNVKDARSAICEETGGGITGAWGGSREVTGCSSTVVNKRDLNWCQQVFRPPGP